MVLLHQARDLEPVGPPSVPAAGLGHADHEALPQPARLARGPVLLVHDAPEVVFALLDHRLVVARPPKEALAALARERSKVETCCGLVADPALLVRQRVEWSSVLERTVQLRRAFQVLELIVL